VRDSKIIRSLIDRLQRSGLSDEGRAVGLWLSNPSRVIIISLIIAGSTAIAFHDKAGNLNFGGGFTGSREQSGNDEDRSAVTSILLNGSVDRSSAFIYGCELMGKDANSQDKAVGHARRTN